LTFEFTVFIMANDFCCYLCLSFCTNFFEPTKTKKINLQQIKINSQYLYNHQSLYIQIFFMKWVSFFLFIKSFNKHNKHYFQYFDFVFTGLAETNKAGKVTSVGYKPCIDMCQVRVVTLTRCVLFLQNVCLWPTGKNKQDISNMDLKHFTDSDQQR
jgi:hypothetical protein